jgi:uncharacterized protein (TIGR02598 family)
MSRNEGQIRAFTLVEVTLALGMAAISLLAIFALLPVGLQTSHSATEQAASNDILAAVIADLRATAPTSPRGNSAISAQFGIDIPGNSGGSGSTVTLYFDSQGRVLPSPAGSRYRVTVTYPPGAGGPRTATFAELKMTWPAVAEPANALGSAETFIALDRN